MGTLYYKTDDGVYHSISEIETVENRVAELDEKLLEGCEGISTIKDLREAGCFEANITDVKIPEDFVEKFDNWVRREIINTHEKYCEISWICELAKRWIKEHAENEKMILRSEIDGSGYGSIDVIKPDGSSLAKFIEGDYSEGFYIAPYEDISFSYDDLKKFLEFFGIAYMEAQHLH